MKHYLLPILIVLLPFYACTEKNNPSIPWNDTGYRLDSMLSYRDGVLDQKQIYYYSVNSKYYDSTYSYRMDSTHWILSFKSVVKYKNHWSDTETSNYYYNNNKWEISDTYCNNHKQDIWIQYIKGEEQVRYEYQYEYDSLGNIVLSVEKTYHKGVFNRYTEIKYDIFYTDQRQDSIYCFRRTDPQAAFECSEKTIVIRDEETCYESISYVYADNKFIPSQKSIRQYDSHGNTTLSMPYSWINNEWILWWNYEATYQYLPNSDLIEIRETKIIDYDKEGNVTHESKTKDVSYYTKL